MDDTNDEQADIIAAELERLRGQDDPAGADLTAVDRALADLGRQQRQLVENLTLVSGSTATLVAGKLTELERQQQRLEQERAAILDRQQAWQSIQVRLDDLSRWCQAVAARLDTMDYAQKRVALEALGVRATVYRSDHDPRWSITTSIPLGGSDASTSTH